MITTEINFDPLQTLRDLNKAMRKPNFDKLSTPVLQEYKSEIEELIRERKKTDEKKSKVLRKVKSMVESEGLSMTDILDGSAPSSKPRKVAAKKTTRKVKPKFANPEDKTQKWSGRGRQPLWVAAYLKQGGALEDLAI